MKHWRSREPLPWMWLTLAALAQASCGGTAEPPRDATAGDYPTAAHYTTQTPAGAAAQTPLHAALAAQVGASLQRDPRLDAAAERLVARQPFATPTGATLDALIRDEGIVDPTPWTSVAMGTEASVIAALTEDVRSLMAQDPRTHYGAASRRDDRGTVGVVLTTRRDVQLERVPRRVEPGETLTLRGTLSAELRDPEWMITQPNGQVVTLPGAKQGRSFDIAVPLERAGVYQVELLAIGKLGVTVVANFPVAAGAPVPVATLTSNSHAAESVDASQVQQQLRQLIARERAAAQLPPLEDDPALTAVALAHNLDMRDTGYVGHTSPSTGEPSARVEAAGLRAWLVQENIGRGYTAQGIHQGLMQSPGHRRNVLSSKAESLGLSVIVIPEGEGEAYLATELFASLSRPVDLQRTRASLTERVAAARKAAGYAKAREDEGLMDAAQAAAAQFLKDPRGKDAFIESAVAKAPLPRGAERLAGSLAILRAAAQLGDAALALDPAAQRFGLGLAQGQRPDTEPDALVLVLLFSM